MVYLFLKYYFVTTKIKRIVTTFYDDIIEKIFYEAFSKIYLYNNTPIHNKQLICKKVYQNKLFI